ncbi:MAG: type II secretion system minor pseudopilin GspK [Gammaproteobacteria bacterium]|nr:type II secretion system minor pseudopilin GspK [Gammaproteobacteria bacterium]
MYTNHRGSALLSALFIMTLVAIATTTLTLQLKTNLDKTRLLFKTQQFQLESVAIRYWAMDALTNKKNKDFGRTPGKSTLIEKKIVFPELPNTHFSGELIDLNARLNINNLKTPTGKTTFYRLTNHLLEDKTGKKSYPLTAALAAWVSDYQPGSTQHNTTFVAHIPMVSLSELSLIPDIKLKDLKLLMPYLTALPPKTRINLNTAPEELLMSMAQGPDIIKDMEELIDARGEEGIASVDSVKSILKKLAIQEDDVTIESEYFLSIGRVKKETDTLTLYSVLQRIKNKDKTYTVRLIHETWNTD